MKCEVELPYGESGVESMSTSAALCLWEGFIICLRRFCCIYYECGLDNKMSVCYRRFSWKPKKVVLL